MGQSPRPFPGEGPVGATRRPAQASWLRQSPGGGWHPLREGAGQGRAGHPGEGPAAPRGGTHDGAGVDVVRAAVAVFRLQQDPGVVVCKGNRSRGSGLHTGEKRATAAPSALLGWCHAVGGHATVSSTRPGGPAAGAFSLSRSPSAHLWPFALGVGTALSITWQN